MEGQEYFGISPPKSRMPQQPSPASWPNSRLQQNQNGVPSPSVPGQRNFYESMRNDTTQLSGAPGLVGSSSNTQTRLGSGMVGERQHGDNLEGWDPMGADYSCPKFNCYNNFDVLASQPPKQMSPEKVVKSPAQQDKPEDISLYVANIPIQMTQEGLRNLFQGAGKVNSCCVLPPSDSSFDNKIGFVTFNSWKEALKAIECYDGFALGGNSKLRVKVANKRRQRKDDMFTKDDYSFSDSDGSDSFTKPVVNGLNGSVGDETKTAAGIMVNGIIQDHATPVVMSQPSSKKPPSSDAGKEQPCTRCQKLCTQRCSACKAPYCSRECQKVDRVNHKAVCSYAGSSKPTTAAKPVAQQPAVDPMNDIDFDCIDISTDHNDNMTEEKAPAKELTPRQQVQPKEMVTNHTNSQPENVALQLPPTPSVAQGLINVLVTSVLSGNCLWGQVIDDNFTRMYEMTQQFSEIREESLTRVAQPFSGTYCLARFTLDNGWYRSRIEQIDNNQVKVMFVDYGNEEWKGCNELYYLPEQFLTLPAQARLFTLSGIRDSLNADVEKALVALVDSLLSGKVFEANVVRVVPGCYPEVVLKETETQRTINEIVIEKQKHLYGEMNAVPSSILQRSTPSPSFLPSPIPQPSIPQSSTPPSAFLPSSIPQHSIPQRSTPSPSYPQPTTTPSPILSPSIPSPVDTTQSAPQSLSSRPSTPSTPSCDDAFTTYMTSDILSEAFPSDKDVDIFICEVASPTVFWIQFPTTAIEKLNQLDVLLDATYRESVFTEYVPIVGELIVAKFSDGLWYRAKVDCIYNDGTLRVTFVDHGNSDDVRLVDVRRVTPELVKVPKLAIRCSLAGVLSPLKSGHWSAECIDFVKASMLSKMCVGSVEGHSGDTVPLYVQVNDQTCTVNDELVQRGYAIPKTHMPNKQSERSTSLSQSTTVSPLTTENLGGQFMPNQAPNAPQYNNNSLIPTPNISTQQPSNSLSQYGTHFQPLPANASVNGPDTSQIESRPVQPTLPNNPSGPGCNVPTPNISTEQRNVPLPQHGTLFEPLPASSDVYGASVSQRGPSPVLPNNSNSPQYNVPVPGSLQLNQSSQYSSSTPIPQHETPSHLTQLLPTNNPTSCGGNMYSANFPQGATNTSSLQSPSTTNPISHTNVYGSNLPTPQDETTTSSLQSPSTSNPVNHINSYGSNVPVPQYETPPAGTTLSTPVSTHYQPLPGSTPHEAPEPSPLGNRGLLPQPNIPSCGFDVVVNDVISADEFYVQMIEPGLVSQLQKCVRDLNMYCESSTRAPVTNVQVGNIGCARFSQDKIWYRAEILDIQPNGYKVRFIDFGNTDVVSHDAFCAPPEVFSQIAPQALCCRLSSVGATEAWSEQIKELLEKLTRNKRLTCTAVSLASLPYVVKLEYSCHGQVVDIANELQKALPPHVIHEGTPSSPRSCTTPTRSGASTPTHSSNISGTSSPPPVPSTQSPRISSSRGRSRSAFGELVLNRAIKMTGFGAIGDQCNLLVNEVMHPTYFWAQIAVREKIEELNKLTADLNEHYTAVSYPPYDPKLNTFCACKFSADNTWYRGFVKTDHTKGWIVHFVDFGNSELSTAEMMRPLEDRFLALPFRAVLCSLACVEPEDGKFWSKEAIEYFRSKVDGRVLKCTIVFNSKSRLFLDIQDPDIEEVSLRSALLAEGMANEAGSYSMSPQKETVSRQAAEELGGSEQGLQQNSSDMVGNTSSDAAVSSENEGQILHQVTPHLQAGIHHQPQSMPNRLTTFPNIPTDPTPVPHGPPTSSNILAGPTSVPNVATMSPNIPTAPTSVPHGPPISTNITAGPIPAPNGPPMSPNISGSTPDPERPMADMFPTVVVDTQNHFNVLVSEVTSPNEIYFNVAEPHTLAPFTDLLQKLNAYFSNTNQSYIPVPGELCCAQFTADQCWYRAIICTVDAESAAVQFVDYGNRDTVKFSAIRPIPSWSTELPFQARRASLARVNTEVIWAENRLSHLRSMLLTKPLIVRVVREVGGVLETEFYDTSGENDILINALFVEQGNTEPAPDAVPNQPSLQILEVIPTNDELEVIVSEVQGPDCFWVQNVDVDAINLFASMTAQMNAACESAHGQLPAVNVGDVCCSKFALDGQWYRARVDELLGNGHGRVFYVDFGNREVVDLAGLKPLDQSYASVPAQAIQCTLGKIQPAQGTWSTNAIDWLKSRIFGKRLIGKVLEHLGSVLKLELIDTSIADQDIIVNAELVQMGEAKCV